MLVNIRGALCIAALIALLLGCSKSSRKERTGQTESSKLAEQVTVTQEPVRAPLSEISDYNWTDESGTHHPAEKAFAKFKGRWLAVEGVLASGGGAPALACHAYDGLHVPADPTVHSRIPLTGKVPFEHGKRHRVVGRLIRNKTGRYCLEVVRWESIEE